jgi:hypothetical protein
MSPSLPVITHNIVGGISDLYDLVRAVQTFDEAAQLWTLIRDLDEQLEAVLTVAAKKVNTLDTLTLTQKRT